MGVVGPGWVSNLGNGVMEEVERNKQHQKDPNERSSEIPMSRLSSFVFLWERVNGINSRG